MIFRLSYFLFFIISFFFFSCTSTNEDFVGYDKTISQEIENFNLTYLDYVKSLNSGDSEDIHIKKNNALHEIKKSRKNLDSLVKIESDENYLLTSLNYFSVLEKSIKSSDSLYLQILSKASGMSNADSVKMKELTRSRNYICDKAFIEFQNSQRKFREKFKIVN